MLEAFRKLGEARGKKRREKSENERGEVGGEGTRSLAATTSIPLFPSSSLHCATPN